MSYVFVNVNTGDYGFGSFEEANIAGTHYMKEEDFTYFDADTAEELIGASDDDMLEMGWLVA